MKTCANSHLLFPFAALAILAGFLTAPAGAATRISEDATGDGGDAASEALDITPDGRYVVFGSASTNLVADDDNAAYDVFLYDNDTGELILVARNDAGVATASAAANGSVSNDGRYVCFAATATDLVAGESDDGLSDVYVKDLDTGGIVIASLADDETEPAADCTDPQISGNGRYVLFYSESDNLIGAGNDTNTAGDYFVRDLQNNTTVRVTLADDESEIVTADITAASLSDDGNFVVFSTVAVLVPADTNGLSDVYVRNVSAQTTERVSVDTLGGDADGASSEGVIAGGGLYAAFSSAATDLVDGDANGATDVFIRDLVNDVTQIVSITTNRSQVDEASTSPTISANGRFVGFSSSSGDFDNLFAGGVEEGFWKDLQTSSVEIVNVTKNNQRGNLVAGVPLVSSNGALAFESGSSNLDQPDNEGQVDVFYAKGVTPKIVVNNALKAAFKKKIKKAREALKRAKKAGKKARVKALKRKIKVLRKKLRSL